MGQAEKLPVGESESESEWCQVQSGYDDGWINEWLVIKHLPLL